MKNKMLIAVMMSLVFSSAIAANNNDENNNKSDKHQTQANDKDAEILGWLVVVNNAEIDAAKEANKRELSSDVKDYADLMVKDHSKNLDQTMDLSKEMGHDPVKNASAKNLEKKATNKLNSMKRLNDKKFESEYVVTMVNDHTNALKDLDKHLKKVKNSDLKSHLSDTREHVSNHLEKAKDLKKELKS